jgi:hypothetical protein
MRWMSGQRIDIGSRSAICQQSSEGNFPHPNSAISQEVAAGDIQTAMLLNVHFWSR